MKKIYKNDKVVFKAVDDGFTHTWFTSGSTDLIMELKKNDRLSLRFKDEDDIKARYIEGEVEPPQPVYKLPTELSFPACDKLVMPFLIVPLLTTKSVHDYDVEWLANELAKSGCNGARSFGFICREENTIQNNHWPFLMNDKNLYHLKTRNPEYVKQMHLRLNYFKQRRLTSVITFFDQGSWSIRKTGKTHWKANPHNGVNNCNNTSVLHESLGHFYEHWNDQTPQGERAMQTGINLIDWVRWMVREFDSPYVVWELINEGRYGSKYHDLWATVLREAGVPKRRRLTSSIFTGFPIKEHLHKDYVVSLHKIDSISSYEYNKQYMPKLKTPWLPSGDGPPPIDKAKAYPLVSKILKDGNVGYEGNDRPIFHNGDWSFRSLNWGVAEEMGRALVDYIRS